MEPSTALLSTSAEQRFGFLVADAHRLYGKRFDDLARGTLDLTRAQSRVLTYLSHRGEINQGQLADLLEVAPISAGRLLDRMEDGGWIVRRYHPEDRRQRLVSMTTKAERALGAARQVGDQVTVEAMNGLTDAEQAALIQLLQRVRANLAGIVER
jgi:DNA-binding MarR family transcriptional regulator